MRSNTQSKSTTAKSSDARPASTAYRQKDELLAQRLDASAQQLILLVGSRVQVARKRRKLSRRELSEKSGLSQRYIAQLEGGEGNISIGLLKRIALTLEVPIEALVTDNDLTVDEFAALITHYRHSDQATRLRALQLLNPSELKEQKAERICLVGLRGAGKSTLGALLGDTLQVPFVELNKEIENSSGIPVGELIALYGQEGYRKLESDELDRTIASHSRLILAVAGGIVTNVETYSKVLASFHTVWVMASPEEHMARVTDQGDLRPMEGNPQAMLQLQHLLSTRSPLYGKATYQLDTSGKSLKESHAELRNLIESHSIIN